MPSPSQPLSPPPPPSFFAYIRNHLFTQSIKWILLTALYCCHCNIVVYTQQQKYTDHFSNSIDILAFVHQFPPINESQTVMCTVRKYVQSIQKKREIQFQRRRKRGKLGQMQSLPALSDYLSQYLHVCVCLLFYFYLFLFIVIRFSI